MLLLGPVALKVGSVFYRFVRYYTGSEPYRRKGRPAPLRVIGPVISGPAKTANARAAPHKGDLYPMT